MSPVAISGVDKQGVYVNGVQVKQALDPANETVNKGVYDPTTLSAVDGDLAVGNIEQGVTIFGKLGTVVPMDVSDANAAVGDVKDPKTFYSVAAPRKTGTMPTVAITAANDDYPAGYHAGNVGGLDAIDADLAPGNIKDGVTIFGKLGTYAQTITHDVQDSDVDSAATTLSRQLDYEVTSYIAAGADGVFLTLTINCAQATVLEAAYFVNACGDGAGANNLKLQMYIDGVAQGESANLTASGVFHLFYDTGYGSVASGNRIVYLNCHSYEASDNSRAFISGGLFAAACRLV